MKFFSFPVRIYLVALILRLVPVILTRELGIGLDDMFQYDMLARSLASGDGYRWYAKSDLALLSQFVDFDLASATTYDPERGIETSFRAPLYPAFLALVYSISGTGTSRFFTARLAQAVFLGAPLAPLTYLTAKSLFPLSERASHLSAWIVAAYPILLLYPLGLGTENLFFLLVCLSTSCLLRAFKENKTVLFLLSGLLLGLSALTRSVILLFAVAAVIWLWIWVSRRGALLSLAVLIITITPWIVRNSILHGRFTGIETSMGYNLYLGYHPQGNGSFVFGPSLDLLMILDDAERDRIGTARALEFIRAQPERFMPLAINRLGYFFGLEKRVLVYFYSNNLVGHLPAVFLFAVFLIFLLPFPIVGICGVLGFAVHARWQPGFILILLLFSLYLLPHVLILSEDRFHLTLVSIFSIFAARLISGGWADFKARLQELPTGRIAVWSGVSVSALLVINWTAELLRDADKLRILFGPFGNQTHFPY